MSCQTLDRRFKRGRAGTFAHEQAQPLVKARRAALTGITIILSTSAPWPNILESSWNDANNAWFPVDEECSFKLQADGRLHSGPARQPRVAFSGRSLLQNERDQSMLCFLHRGMIDSFLYVLSFQ